MAPKLGILAGSGELPLRLIDACRANPKGTYRVRSGTVHVVFHEPISLEGQTREQRDA